MPLLARTDLPRMTKDEFFAWAERQPIPYELVGGVPVPLHWELDEAGRPRAMAAGSDRHHAMIANATVAIHRRLPPGCRVLSGGGALSTDDGTVREPDVLLACGPRRDSLRESQDPTLIVEVLSPSTAAVDRGEKLPEYQDLASVREIWIVDSARRHVALHTRGEGDTWVSRNVIGQGTIASPTLTAGVPLDELYDGVDL
jgi:Uma2 family endonuclease